MAELNEVVGMFSKVSASLLELAKKWLKFITDGKVDVNHMLNTLHQISKEQFLGLAKGTYQIVRKPNSDDLFELFYESDFYITVPNMEKVNEYCEEKWNKTLAGAIPSNLLEADMKKKIRVYKPKGNYSSETAVNFVTSISGAKLYGLPGLAVAEITNGSNLPRDKWLLSFDNKDNLSVVSHGYRRVPYLYLDSGGTVDRGCNRWPSDWPTDFCLVVLCD